MILRSVKMELMNAQEVSEQIFRGAVSYQTIIKLAHSGDMPCAKIGRKIFFTKEKVEEYLKNKFTEPYHQEREEKPELVVPGIHRIS